MRKKILLVVGITILFLGTCITPSVAINNVKNASIKISDSNTLYVGGTGEGNYSSIQDAIDNASIGDTVFVYDDSSPYDESITIDNSIILNGENKETTIITSNFPITVILLKGSGITVSNFTIKGEIIYGISSYGENIHNNTIQDNIFDGPDNGIEIRECSNYKVLNNIFLNRDSGISIGRSSIDAKVINNSFIGTGLEVGRYSYKPIITIMEIGNIINGKPLVFLQDESNKVIDGGAGQVIILGCNNITIKNQEIESVNKGICVLWSSNIMIENNSILSCIQGIEVIMSEDNCFVIIRNNYIRSCYEGCYLRYSRLCNIINNSIILSIGNNFIFNGFGIYLYDSHYCNISKNKIKMTGISIVLQRSSNNILWKNDISKFADIGIELISSNYNKIYYNNFNKRILIPSRCARFRFEINETHQNFWFGNYWNRPRLNRKVIYGIAIKIMIYFPFIRIRIGREFDYNPASVPNDIEVQ